MLRITIIGCGKIADQHVAAIRRISGCEIAAVCVRELLMAGQLGDRFGITACFADAAEMLRAAGLMSSTSQRRRRDIFRWPRNASNPAVMFLSKNLSQSRRMKRRN